MILLAIDPGSKLGYAVFDITDGELTLFHHGTFTTQSDRPMEARSSITHNHMKHLFLEYEPDVCVVEYVLPLLKFTPSKEGVYWLATTFDAATRYAYQRGCTTALPLPRQWKAQLFPGVAQKGVAKKHVSVDYVNARFNLKLKLKDHDVAEAICMGCWYYEFKLQETMLDAS